MEQPVLERAERHDDDPAGEIRLDLAYDGEWLSRLGTYKADTETIAYANELLQRERAVLLSDNHDETAKLQLAREERRKFYEEVLFWNDTQHKYHDLYDDMLFDLPYLCPLDEFVARQRSPENFAFVEAAEEPGSPETYDDRYANLVAWGLDAQAIMSAEPSVAKTAIATVNAKIETIRELLEYIGSKSSVKTVVSERPNLLVSSPIKMRSLVRMLEGSVDPHYIANLDAKRLGQFITVPIDSVLAAVAKKSMRPGFAPDGLTRQDIVSLQKQFPSATARRSASMELLGDSDVRTRIGRRAVGAYVEYAPIKFDEIKHVPELAEVVHDHGWSALSLDAPLARVELNHHDDGDWLAGLAGRQCDDDMIARASLLMTLGSLDLRSLNPQQARLILDARHEFFEHVLGWGDERHPYFDVYQHVKAKSATLTTLSKIADMQHLFKKWNIDGVDLAIRSKGEILFKDPDNMEQRLRVMGGLGVDVAHAFAATHRVAFASVHTIRAAFGVIENTIGLDERHIFQVAPGLLTANATDLRARINYLLEQGIAADTINKSPSMLAYKLEKTKKNIEKFTARELDGAAIINHCLYAYGMSEKQIDSRLNELEVRRLDPIKLITALPRTMSRELASIDERLERISDCAQGYDAAELVNREPGLLTAHYTKLAAEVRRAARI